MKKAILSLLVTIPSLLFAQEDFSLKGTITGVDAPAKVFIRYVEAGQRHMDSVNIEKGSFSYNGVVSEPTQAQLILSKDGKSLRELENPDVTMVYLSKGVINIKGNDLATAEISGNQINKDFAAYKGLLSEITSSFAALNKEFLDAPEEKKQDEEFVNSLQERANELFAQQKKINADYLKQNPDSYVSLGLLEEMISPSNLNEEIIPSFDKMSPALKNSTRGKAIAAKIERLKSVAIGAVAPEIALPDTAGNVVKLSSLRGKYVLIDFWASWCGPCRHENPTVVAAFNKFKDKNFTVFGVSLDRPNAKADWIQAIKDDGLTQWPQVSDLKFWQSEVVELYGIEGIPQNFLIDPNGKIIASNLRGEALEKKLAEVIK